MRTAVARKLTDEKIAQARLGYRRHARRRNLVIVGTGRPVNDERPLTFQGVGSLDEPSRRDGSIPQ